MTSQEWWTVDEKSLAFKREFIVLILLFALCFSVRKLRTNNFLLLVTIIVQIGLCVKAVTEQDSADSTEITDRTQTESTEYNGKLRVSDTEI